MTEYSVMIIDDEEPARELLRHYINDIEGVSVIAECANGFDGLKEIGRLKPDILLLDIQMPKLNGFELLEVITENPVVIFTTAYDQYALKAFDMNAADYLLKPFSIDRLKAAIAKAVDTIGKGDRKMLTIKPITDNLPDRERPLSRIVVRKGNAIAIIPVNKIRYIEAGDDYATIHYHGGKALKQQRMKYYDKNLPGDMFCRIHRSYIVMLDEIVKIEPYGKESYVAVMKGDERIPVSKSGYKTLKQKLHF